MLDVGRLRVIDALARLGSVTAAAKELHYTQPTVSHHLARLEAETGAQLLQRAGRRVRLTPAGQLLASRRPRSSAGSMPPTPNCPPT
jgi:DNA-binding transcriptional LysR family regulator